MNHKFNILLLIFGFTILFFIVNETNTFLFSFNKEKETRYETNKKIFDNLSNDHKQNVNILSAALALNPTVQEAYMKNDPKMIIDLLLPVWNRLRQEKLIYEIHFFKPPAISFVNFSNFKSIGSDVSDVRKDIQWVTSSFKPSLHIMMCKSYAGIRATYPILDKNGTMLGGLSMGKTIDWIPDKIKQQTGDESFLVYTTEAAKSLTSKYYHAFMKDKQVVGDFIYAEHTMPVPVESIRQIDVHKPISTITIDNKQYILFSYPIIDFNHQVMGYLFTMNDFSYYYATIQKRVISSFIIIFLSALVIFLIANKRLDRMIMQSKYISNLSRRIKSRDFTVLNDTGNTFFQPDEILSKVKNDVLDMGRTIETKYCDLENQLLKQVYTDDLTQLPNRNAMMSDLQKHKNAKLILFNIRSFKQINDVFGFSTGNVILSNLAKNILAFLKDRNHLLYRIGSDEFGLLLINQDSESVLNTVKSVIHHINNLPIQAQDDLEINISLYAGICLDNDDRLVKADMALTQANKTIVDYVIYTEKEDTKEKQKQNVEMSKIINNAIKNNAIVTHFQPILSIQTNQINKYEALARIRHDNALLTPEQFLEVSRQTQFYHMITRSVIKQSFEIFNSRSESVSVNLTAIDLHNDETIDFIFKELDQFSQKERIIFELSESHDLYHSPEVKSFIEKVKALGVKIAIDDFGTGYSNFSYLMKLKPDYLKLDGSLIKDIDHDYCAKNIVQTIVHFANELEIKTIAEFVHNKEIYDMCKELNINALQGHYIGKAQPIEPTL